MPKHLAAAFLAALSSTSALAADGDTLLAQARTPTLPGAPQPTPQMPQGLQGSSGNYTISAAANEHGSFLWIVDSIQRAVVLCEKTDSRDFTCTKKPLP